MSYEGDLVAHYDATHKRLLDPPTAIKKTPPLVPLPPSDLRLLPVILMRLEGLEASIQKLNTILRKDEGKTKPVSPQNSQPRCVSVENIVEMVLKREHLERGEVLGPQRHQRLVTARHYIAYLSSRWTLKSLSQIGRVLGDRDHTTILNSISKMKRQRVVDATTDSALFWYETRLRETTDPVHSGDKLCTDPPAILTEVTEHL